MHYGTFLMHTEGEDFAHLSDGCFTVINMGVNSLLENITQSRTESLRTLRENGGLPPNIYLCLFRSCYQ